MSQSKRVTYTGTVTDINAVQMNAYPGIYRATPTSYTLSVIYPITAGDGKLRVAEEVKTTTIIDNVISETVLPRVSVFSGEFQTIDEVLEYAGLIIDKTINGDEDTPSDTE